MDEIKISTNTARNTPFQNKHLKYNYLDLVSEDDKVAILERRLEKIEKLLHLSDEMTKLRQEQEETRINEINRRVDDFDKRLRRVEENMSHSLIDLEHKVENHEIQLAQFQDMSALKSDLEDLKYNFYTDDRLAGLEKEIGSKMIKICDSLEEIANELNKGEKDIDNLKNEMINFQGEINKENLVAQIKNLKDNIDEL